MKTGHINGILAHYTCTHTCTHACTHNGTKRHTYTLTYKYMYIKVSLKTIDKIFRLCFLFNFLCFLIFCFSEHKLCRHCPNFLYVRAILVYIFNYYQGGFFLHFTECIDIFYVWIFIYVFLESYECLYF